jgi:hypothetical protein
MTDISSQQTWSISEQALIILLNFNADEYFITAGRFTWFTIIP